MRYILTAIVLLCTACSPYEEVVEVMSGNTLVLSSGIRIRMSNVLNSRWNYDFLCENIVWQDVIFTADAIAGDTENATVWGMLYTADGTCINDMLEKELPPSSTPTPPDLPPVSEESSGESETPPDTEIPAKPTMPQSISDREWHKPNIKSTKDISQIYSYVIDVFKSYDIDYMPHIPVHVIPRPQMLAESGSPSAVGLAYTTSYDDGDLVFEIHVIEGLSKLDFAEVLGHEMMHTWINQNGIEIKKEADLEGLCNYASYLVLSSVDTDYSASLIKRMMQNPDPVYGVGFRNVKCEVDQIGLDNYLSRLRRSI
ncbi:protein DA1 [Alistipes sp.]|uniref:protein DA1 n=1 Tax=Alistipes sp. TaxID=1872444 RepID=UPI0025C5CC04|nr:protein DA1 [Alistipes sp.]